MKVFRGINEILDLGFNPEGIERKELMVEHTVSFSFERSVYIKLEKGDSITHNGKLFYLKDDYIPTINKSTNGFVYDLKFYDIMEWMKYIKLKYNGETDFKLTVTGEQFLDVVVSSFSSITKGSFPEGFKEIHFENVSVFDALNLITETYDTEWWLNGSTLNLSKCEFGSPVILRLDTELEDISVSQSSETLVTRLYAKGSTRNIPKGYSQDNRLKLATGYIDLIPDLPESKIIEGVHIFEDIYPRQTTSIVEVIQGSVGDTPIFTIRGNNAFTITQNDVIPGQPLKIAFNTGNLAGREFELIIRADNKFEIKYIQDGELVIPNLTLKPAIGDEFFFFNFNAESVLPTLIAQAENELLVAAQDYLDNLGSQLVYDCETRSIYCEQNVIDLAIGQVVTIQSENIGSVTTRIRAYEKQLLNSFECKYQAGDYSKYSRLKEIANRIKDSTPELQTLRSTLEYVFQDGIVTESELKSIEAILTNLSVERGQLNAQYLVVRGNVNLINKTPLETAWSNYQTAFVDVETAINNAITDKLISDAEKANIYNKISVYSTRTNEFATALENARVAIEDNKNQGVLDVVDQNKQYLQDQIDGVVDNWFYPYSPTLANYPASDWTTNAIKDRHIGDTFTNTQQAPAMDAGKSWRFVKNGSVYSWTLIADSDAVLALQKAAQAQSTADGKSTTYLIQPTSYKFGDMWVLAADQTVNGIAYKQGDILTATQDGTTYNQAHWVKKVRYTDDTKANQVASSLANFTDTVFPQEKNQLQSQIDGKIETHFTASDPATAWTTADLKTKHTGDMWFNSTTKKLNRYSGSAWVLIEDQKAIDAFNTASTAKDTADGKRRVFTATPTVPYDVGDLWAQGTGGDLMRCITAKTSAQTYSVADWEKASKYTDDTAVENLQIGGVNLLINSKNYTLSNPIFAESTATDSGMDENFWIITLGSAYLQINIPLKAAIGDNFTLSFIHTRRSSSVQNFQITYGLETKQFISNSSIQKTELTFTKTNDTYLRISRVEGGSGWSFRIDEIQIEKGSKATDWSPAPEDVQAEITAAKQEALAASNTVQTNVNSLNNYVDTAFKDGLIDEAEAKAIEKYKNTINETMAKAEASYLKVYANTYLDGTAKTDLGNAKINLWGQRDTLLSAINTAIADGKTTIAEKNAVDSAFNTFNSLMSAFQSALEEANKAIQTKLDTLSTEKVNNLQIGGVNLINGDTKLIERTEIGWTRIPLSKQLVAGNTYILGGEFRIDSGTSGLIGLNDGNYAVNFINIPKNTPFVASAAMSALTHFALAKQVGASDLIVSAKEVKLEEGNKKSTWSQSPEYVDAKINQAKQEALTAAGNAQTSANTANTAVGNLNTYVDGSFKDGVIEASEAKAIEKYINVVNTEKSNLEATYNTLYTNTYLEGTPKTNLLNAKVTYFGAVDTLLNSINTAISDGKTTAAEKQAVDTNYSSYKTALASLQTAIENANKAIQAKLDAISKMYVDNLQIGGRNLLVGSRNYTLSNPIFAGSTAGDGGMDENFWILTLGTEYLRIIIPSGIQTGEKFVLSFKHTRRALSAQVFQVGYDGVNYIFNSTSGVVKSAFPLTKAAGNYIDISRAAGGSGWSIRIDEIQIELGDKPTDWSPAPEDVQAGIDAAKLTAEQAKLAADGYMRARYVRDWLKGNTDHNNNNWSEIKVVNKAGVNLALGLPANNISSNGTWHASYPKTNVVDGNTSTQGYISQTTQTENYVQIDLGQIYYDIDYVGVWHAGWPTRLYYGTKTEISVDGVNWTTVFDSAKSGTYKETAAGNIISLRPHEVLAKTLKSQAITDKFGATIDGGLIGAVTMLLRELNSTDETAGISGIRGANRNLPAFWTGTYADAIAGTAGIIFRHNSTGKIGVLDVDANGNVKLLDSIDPSIVRLLFSKSAIPSIESIRSGSDSGSVQNASVLRNTTLTSILPETATIANNGVHMSISGSLRISAGLAAGSNYGEAYVGLSLYKNDVFYSIISQYDMILESASLTTETTPFNVSLNVPAGTYSLVLETSFLNASSGSQAGTNTATTMTWVFEASIRRFEWGTNGFMNYRPNGHIHHTEEKGLDIRGATNMPGILLSGSVAIGGGFVNSWGAKKHATLNAQKTATGTYTVYHSAGHTGYSVQITPETDQRVYYIPTASKGTSSFIVYFRNLSGTLSDSAFSFSIMGDNYIT